MSFALRIGSCVTCVNVPLITVTSTYPVVRDSLTNKNKRPIKQKTAKTIAQMIAHVGILLSVRVWSRTIHRDPATGALPLGVTTQLRVTPMSPLVTTNCSPAGTGGGGRRRAPAQPNHRRASMAPRRVRRGSEHDGADSMRVGRVEAGGEIHFSEPDGDGVRLLDGSIAQGVTRGSRSLDAGEYRQL